MSGRRRRWLGVSLLLALALQGIAVSAQSPARAATTTITYAAAGDNFPNPERGVYVQFAPFYLGTERYPLDWMTIAALRSSGISLIRAYYVFDEFRDVPLPASALDAVSADLTAVRQAGAKVIPRFVYSLPCMNADDPCTDESLSAEVTDPPLGRVLAHIDQLTPLLRANADVIAFMEMGFVGAWGEWHHSSSGLVNADRTVNGSSAAIVDRVLAALPTDRMAALRYPYHKQQLFDAAPLTAEQAFSRTPKARLGAHNDCFLWGEIGGGTYSPPASGPGDKTISALRQYLSDETRFVPQGGETCSSDASARPLIQCGYALSELALTHWSTINSTYYPDVIALWREQGCYPEIERRLGYRFRLVSAEIPTSVLRGAPLALSVTLLNDGFAAPYNPRPPSCATLPAAGQWRSRSTPTRGLGFREPPIPSRWLGSAPPDFRPGPTTCSSIFPMPTRVSRRGPSTASAWRTTRSGNRRAASTVLDAC